MVTNYPSIPGVTFKEIGRFLGYCFGDNGTAWGRRGRGKHHGRLFPHWKELVPRVAKKGRRCLRLTGQDGRRHDFALPRLILEAFVGPCPEGMEACHFPDRDPGNNHLGNLRWGTRLENFADRDIHGTTARGERVGRSKMTEAKVGRLRELRSMGWKYDALAGHFGIGKSQVARIIHGTSWAHIREGGPR